MLTPFLNGLFGTFGGLCAIAVVVGIPSLLLLIGLFLVSLLRRGGEGESEEVVRLDGYEAGSIPQNGHIDPAMFH